MKETPDHDYARFVGTSSNTDVFRCDAMVAENGCSSEIVSDYVGCHLVASRLIRPYNGAPTCSVHRNDSGRVERPQTNICADMAPNFGGT